MSSVLSSISIRGASLGGASLDGGRMNLFRLNKKHCYRVSMSTFKAEGIWINADGTIYSSPSLPLSPCQPPMPPKVTKSDRFIYQALMIWAYDNYNTKVGSYLVWCNDGTEDNWIKATTIVTLQILSTKINFLDSFWKVWSMVTKADNPSVVEQNVLFYALAIIVIVLPYICKHIWKILLLRV